MDVFMDLYGHYFLEKDIRSVRLMLNAAHNDLYSMLFSIDFKAPGKVLFLSLFLGVCVVTSAMIFTSFFLNLALYTFSLSSCD